MQYVISVKNLTKTYRTWQREAGLLEAFKSLIIRKFKEVRALTDISFEIRSGEIVGLIGPNGAGKSTLIKILTGVLTPDSGQIDVLGFNPFKDRIKYAQYVGVLFGQKSQLWWDIPPIDAFYVYRDLYEIEPKDFEKRLNYMVKLLGVEEIIKRPVRKLSLGERMRCELIAALLHRPKIVFLDEPTIGMDIVVKDIIRDFIKRYNRKYNSTFLITTHDMSDIEALCPRILIINKGEIIYDGKLASIRRIYANKKLLHVQFASPPGKLTIPGCKIRQTKYRADIVVDLTKQELGIVIHKLVARYKIDDITVSDPSIESIIKKIYRK